MSRNIILLVLAIVAFILGAVAGQTGDDIILNAAAWFGAGSALFVAAHLPA